MNTKIKFTRFVFALALALSALGVSVTAALANPPTKYEFSITVPADGLTGECSFPINLVSTMNITGIDFVDKNGDYLRSFWHLVTQDTFSANGKTLVGIPYTYNLEFSDTKFIIHGVIEKIPLPDGSLFISAGRVDLSANPWSFVFTPDNGKSGNVAGFCAALAP